MEIKNKTYKTLKAKKHLKKNNILFFFNGVNRNSNNWLLTEQGLKIIHFTYYKIFNRTANKALKNSIYTNTKYIINGPTFFIEPQSFTKFLSKQTLLNNFEPLLFVLLAIKLNNKIYSSKQLKNTKSLEYTENKIIFYQFCVGHIKILF